MAGAAIGGIGGGAGRNAAPATPPACADWSLHPRALGARSRVARLCRWPEVEEDGEIHPRPGGARGQRGRAPALRLLRLQQRRRSGHLAGRLRVRVPPPAAPARRGGARRRRGQGGGGGLLSKPHYPNPHLQNLPEAPFLLLQWRKTRCACSSPAPQDKLDMLLFP